MGAIFRQSVYRNPLHLVQSALRFNGTMSTSPPVEEEASASSPFDFDKPVYQNPELINIDSLQEKIQNDVSTPYVAQP
jgi:hypothetical protein